LKDKFDRVNASYMKRNMGNTQNEGRNGKKKN